MNTFKSYPASQVPSTGGLIYTVPALTQTVGVGMVVSNTDTSPYSVDIYITRDSTDFYIIKSATIPVGGSLVVAGVDQKLIMEAGDEVVVKPSADNACDVWLSVLEVVPTND
jgi:hypothetical protein